MADNYHSSDCFLRIGGDICTCGFVPKLTDKQVIAQLHADKDALTLSVTALREEVRGIRGLWRDTIDENNLLRADLAHAYKIMQDAGLFQNARLLEKYNFPTISKETS